LRVIFWCSTVIDPAVPLRTMNAMTLDKWLTHYAPIRTALEDAGVEFIDENGGGPGVRLRQRRQLKTPKK
jgi:hypothetical protein